MAIDINKVCFKPVLQLYVEEGVDLQDGPDEARVDEPVPERFIRVDKV